MKKKAIIATCLSLVLLFALTGVVWAGTINYQTINTTHKRIGTESKQTVASTGSVKVTGVSTETVRWYAYFKDSNHTYAGKSAIGNATVYPASGVVGTNISLYMYTGSGSVMVYGSWNP